MENSEKNKERQSRVYSTLGDPTNADSKVYRYRDRNNSIQYNTKQWRPVLTYFSILSKSLNFFQLVPQMLQAAGQLLMLTSLITYCLFVLFNAHNPVDFPPVRVG